MQLAQELLVQENQVGNKTACLKYLEHATSTIQTQIELP
jgi:hypothetical protein